MTPSRARRLARAWLYRIATNVCLDMIRSKSRRVQELHSFAEVSWLTPYPDRLLDELASDEDEPDVVAVARETIELAFLAALAGAASEAAGRPAAAGRAGDAGRRDRRAAGDDGAGGQQRACSGRER